MYSMNHRGKQKYFGSTQGQLLRLPPPYLSQFRVRDTSHLSVLTRGYSSFKLAMQTHYQTQMHRVSAHSMLVLNVDSHLASLALMCPSLSLSLELPEKNKNKQSTKSLGTDCRQRRWQHLLPRPACRLALPHCLGGGAAVGSSALLAQCHTAEHQQQRSTWTENWAALCQLLREKCKGVLPLFSVPAYVCVCNTIR